MLSKISKKSDALRKDEKLSPKKKTAIVLVVACAIVSSVGFAVFAKKGGGGGQGGGGTVDDDESVITKCGTAKVCYAFRQKSYSGLKWVYVPPTHTEPSYYKNSGPYTNVVPGSAPTVAPKSGSDDHIDNCGDVGYYVFGSFRYYNGTTNPTGDMKGPFWLKEYYDIGSIESEISKTWSDGSYTVSMSEASAAFAEVQRLGWYKNYNWSVGNFSAFCAYDKEPEEPEDPPRYDYLDCDDINGIEVGGANYGNTMGDTYIKNLSSTSAMRNLISSGNRLDDHGFLDTYVFAKPGDSIQFRHRLCSAAMNVQGTSLYEDKDNDDGVGQWSGGDATAFGTHAYNNVNYKFAISATPNVKYAFGKDADDFAHEGAPGTWHSVNEGASKTPLTNSIFNGLPADDKSAIGFQIFSPSVSADDMYKCNPQYAINFGNSWLTPGYQVPGFTETPTLQGGACKAASNTDGVTDRIGAGHTISQSIYWNNIVGFEQLRGSDTIHDTCTYTGSECGKYDITDDHRYSDSWNRHDDSKDDEHAYRYGEYEKVKSASGAWGWHKAGCAVQGCNYAGCCTYDTGEDDEDGNDIYDSDDEWDSTHGSCCYDEYIVNSDPWYRPIYFYDQTAYQGKSYETDSAKVYTPYNFSTSVGIDITNSPVIYGGAKVSSNWTYSIVPKSNQYTADYSYATITPPGTKVQVIEFTLDENATTVKGGDSNVAASVVNGDICNYFSHTGCEKIVNSGDRLNATGDYSGHNYDGSASRAVPDVAAGTKYCVAIGVYPADSLNWDSPTIANLQGLGMEGGNTWNISDPVCRTIAKKPSFQVWNGGIFTPSKVLTSLSRKWVGVGLGNNYDKDKTTIFGSWDETVIVANDTVKSMASASGLGYNGNDNKNHYNFSLKGGVPNGTTYDGVSHLTISNVDTTKGHSGIGSVSSALLKRLKSRYTGINNHTSTTLPTGLVYQYYSGDYTLAGLTKGAIAPDANGVYKDNTTVIEVNGTLTISGNICYGSCTTGESVILSNQSLGADVSSIAALPQVLIFAKDVDIKENVTRIDAWLIVDEGEIDTCSNYDKPTSNQCNKTLIVNGPVFAKTLSLSRTAGAWPGAGTQEGNGVLSQNLTNDGSTTPAEIFNLRTDAYLWAYNQAQRNTEAVVTYSRELAPRY